MFHPYVIISANWGASLHGNEQPSGFITKKLVTYS